MSIAIPPFKGEAQLIGQRHVSETNSFYTYDGSSDCDENGNIIQGGYSFQAYRYKEDAGGSGTLIHTSLNFQENGQDVFCYYSGFGTYHGWYNEFQITAPQGANYNILYLPEDFFNIDLRIGFDFSEVTFETSDKVFDDAAFRMNINNIYAMVDGDTLWEPVNHNEESYYYLDSKTGPFWPPDWAFAMNNVINNRNDYSPKKIKRQNHVDYAGREAQTTNATVKDKKTNTTVNCNRVTCRTGVNRIVNKLGITTSMWKNINGFPVEYPALGNWNLGPFIIFKNNVVFRVAVDGYIDSCDMTIGSSSSYQNPKGTLYRGDFTLQGALHSYKI